MDKDYTKSCWTDLKESLLKENPLVAEFNVDGNEFVIDQRNKAGFTFLVLTKKDFDYYKDGLNVKNGAKAFSFGKNVMVYFDTPSSDNSHFHQFLFRSGTHYFDAPKACGNTLRGRFWKLNGYSVLSCWDMRKYKYEKIREYQNGILKLFKIFGVNPNEIYIENSSTNPSMNPSTSGSTEPKKSIQKSIPWSELNNPQPEESKEQPKLSPEIEKKVKELERKLHTSDPILKKKIKSQIDSLLSGTPSSKKSSITPSSHKASSRSFKAGFDNVAKFNHTFNSARGIDEKK